MFKNLIKKFKDNKIIIIASIVILFLYKFDFLKLFNIFKVTVFGPNIPKYLHIEVNKIRTLFTLM